MVDLMADNQYKERKLFDGQSGRMVLCYLVCGISAFVALFIYSKCSPLYPFNDWYDANVFFTMGKGMVKGRVIYAELYDHKGPYLYLLYGIGYLISHCDFYGIFLLEVISLFLFLVFSYRTICLYAERPSLWFMPVYCIGIVISGAFVHGGSLEEFSLSMLSYALYSILRLLKTGEIKTGTVVINGFLAGVLFWSKFTLVGAHAVFFLIMVFYFWKAGQRREAIHLGLVFAGAVILATVPWLIYFGIHNAYASWFGTYLWDNIYSYPTDKFSFGKTLRNIVVLPTAFLIRKGNLMFTAPIILGAVGYLFLPGKITQIGILERITVFAMAGGLAAGQYIGGADQSYYGLPLAIFGILFPICALLLKWTCFSDFAKSPFWGMAVSMVVLGISSVAGYPISDNTYLLGVSKAELPQFRFAEQIRQAGGEEQTILNYGFLDCGIYTVLDQVPDVYYFCSTNLNYDKIVSVQDKYLKDQITRYVVSWKPYQCDAEELLQPSVLTEYYELKDYCDHYMECYYYTYALWERK